MKRRYILFYLGLLIIGFILGVYVTNYKKFPYNEIRSTANFFQDLITPINEKQIFENEGNSYPHLRVVNKLSETKSIFFILRSEKLELPVQINLFDPINGKKKHSLDISNFNIDYLPKEQCFLKNREACLLYVKLELKTDVKIIGTYIASTAERINYTALEPKSDIVRFENVENCEIAVVYPDYTALAYNTYGNFSLYTKPFPVPGDMGSSMVAYDRPFYSKDINNSYTPAKTISETILEMQLGCVNIETNSSLEFIDNLDQYKLIVITGHDEYWTDSLRKNIDKFVKLGGSLAVFSGNTNFRRIMIEGNKVYRDKYTSQFYPSENITGLATRFGGIPVRNLIELDKLETKNIYFTEDNNLRGMKVINDQHPIFKNTNLKKNDFFGINSELIWYEIDGAPLNPFTDEIDYQIMPEIIPIYDGVTVLDQPYEAFEIIPLASSYLSFFGGKPQYAASFVEYFNGEGRVLNGGSVGWYKVLEKDPTSKQIFKNSIKYLFELHKSSVPKK